MSVMNSLFMILGLLLSLFNNQIIEIMMIVRNLKILKSILDRNKYLKKYQICMYITRKKVPNSVIVRAITQIISFRWTDIVLFCCVIGCREGGDIWAVHQFIIHCLIPSDPCIGWQHEKYTLFRSIFANFSITKTVILH